jgi:hypothetical protein
MIDRLVAGSESVVRASWRGVPGHPLLVAAHLFPELMGEV